MKLEIMKIGNSTGLILPKELINRLGLAEGDAVIISETPTGFSVSRTDPAFEKGLKIARRAMKTYRNALSTLAK
jgi:putative addiction module antidote